MPDSCTLLSKVLFFLCLVVFFGGLNYDFLFYRTIIVYIQYATTAMSVMIVAFVMKCNIFFMAGGKLKETGSIMAQSLWFLFLIL